jgi:16S rRNA (cytosine967-C5)-methyltransferase
MNLRLIAAHIIDAVTQGRSLSDELDAALSAIPAHRDRSFVQALCYGVCRYYARLDVILSHLLSKPMKAKDSDVHALLLVGLYQLLEMRVPEHAAVAETVNAAQKLKKPWARGLVNAILREFLRQKASLLSTIQQDVEALYAHPQWWIDAVKIAWPDAWESILVANNMHPPFSLRVNQKQCSRADYLKILIEKGFQADLISETEMGVILAEPIAIETLPGFLTGDVSVQDGAAQLAAPLLQAKTGMRVLDACAAPGGKLAHLLELTPDLTKVTAIDVDPKRILLIKDTLSRLKLTADVICADVGEPADWWDGQLFDRILLDAPCSASGVIRRHPDIKLLREPEDIPALADEQLRILTALWPLLAPGGVLLYATCSIFPTENVDVIREFLATHPEAKEDKIQANWGMACEFGRQILPGMHQMDGFYYARLRK